MWKYLYTEDKYCKHYLVVKRSTGVAIVYKQDKNDLSKK